MSKINSIKRTAAQTAILMAILTLASKLLGFVREMIMAGFYGTSYITDAYVMAQSIPGILFGGIFAAIGASYMPLLAETIAVKSDAEGNGFTSKVLNLILVCATITATIGIIFAEPIVHTISNFDARGTALTIVYVRIVFLYVIFSAGMSIFSAYLQYKGRFLAPIIAGYSLNLMIIAVIIFSAFTSHYYLAFGLLLGNILYFVITAIYAGREGYRHTLDFRFGDTVKQVAVLAVPVFIGVYVGQINVFVDKMLASGLPEGSVSALNYANLIISLIVGLTISVLTTMSFPKLNQFRAAEDMKNYNRVLSKAYNIVIMIGVPFSLGAILFAEEVVQVIYERGAFDVGATALTAIALVWYAPTLLFNAINTLSTQVFHTHKDMTTPMLVGFATVAVNVTGNLVLVEVMGIAGLALATSMAGFCSCVLLYMSINKKYPQIQAIESWKKVGAISLSGIVSVTIGRGVYNLLAMAIWMPRLCYLIAAMGAAAAVYLALLKVCKVKELELVREIIARRK